ncbi:MAG: hypothetical protein ACM32E_08125, partial [Gemmatimonadota bacterium]
GRRPGGPGDPGPRRGAPPQPNGTAMAVTPPLRRRQPVAARLGGGSGARPHRRLGSAAAMLAGAMLAGAAAGAALQQLSASAVLALAALLLAAVTAVFAAGRAVSGKSAGPYPLRQEPRNGARARLEALYGS